MPQTVIMDDIDSYGEGPIRADYSIEDSEEVLLARLVLAQASSDAEIKSPSDRRTCARAFLTNPSEDLERLCLKGRINLGYLLRLKRNLYGVVPWPENYWEAFDRDKTRSIK